MNTTKEKLTPVNEGTDQSKRLVLFRKKYIAKSSGAAADNLGLDRPGYWRMENGTYKINVEVISKLTEKYRLNPEWLLHGALPMRLGDKQKLPGGSITELAKEVHNLSRLLLIMKKNNDVIFDKVIMMEKTIQNQQKEITELKKSLNK